jgi:hypothetical protein
VQTALTITGIFANLATIAAIGFLVWQIKIAVEQTRLAREAMREEHNRREAERAQERDALLMALGLEVHAIRESMDLDERLFRPTVGLQDDQAKARHIAVTTEGQAGYTRGYAWTSLPFGTVERAIREGNLLGLTIGQTEACERVTCLSVLLRFSTSSASEVPTPAHPEYVDLARRVGRLRAS